MQSKFKQMKQPEAMRYDFSAFRNFWQRYWSQSVEVYQHPEDMPFFELQETRGQHKKTADFDFRYHPCPFDGPLEKAKVILCLANPNYASLPGGTVHQNDVIKGMRDGAAPLPDEWLPFYERVFGEFIKQGISVPCLKKHFAIFNVCAYASVNMNSAEVAHAAGLPSTWAAQQYLRSNLIPRAQEANTEESLYLVFLRKHQLWGVTEGFRGNIEVVRGSERSGVVPPETAEKIVQWLHETYLARLDLRPAVAPADC
jgi:hypothetical protein